MLATRQAHCGNVVNYFKSTHAPTNRSPRALRAQNIRAEAIALMRR